MTPPATNVTVLGLGAMGSAIARCLVDAGHRITVWNRTHERTEPLVALGALAADSPGSAVRSADLVIVSLVDGDAALDVLGTTRAELAGRTVVELTSMTPVQAAEVHQLVTDSGGVCLSGAVMVPPQMIGTSDGTVLYDDDRTAYDRWAATLDAIAPTKVFVSEVPGSAATLDMGMLDVFYGAVTSVIHGATIADLGGVKPDDFIEHARSMLTLANIVVEDLATELTDNVFPGGDNNLQMMLRGIHHVVETTRQLGVDAALPEVTERLMQTAVDRGYGRDGYGRVAELLRT